MILQRITNWMKYWYLPLIAGIVMIGIGITMYAAPARTISIMMLLFSFSIITFGLVELLQFLKNGQQIKNKLTAPLSAILMIVIGLVLFGNPLASIVYINTVIAVLLVSKSIQNIISQYSKPIQNRTFAPFIWMSSLVLIMIAMFLWNRPEIISVFLVSISGLPFLLMGILGITAAVLLRNGSKKIQSIRSRFEPNTQDADYEIIN